MDLTPENKKIIDDKSYRSLLNGWRYMAVGDPWFQGKTGVYWANRMKDLRALEPDPVAVSKSIDRERGL